MKTRAPFAAALPAANGVALVRAASTSKDMVLVLQIDESKVTSKGSPTLHRLLTQEIDFSDQGGLHAPLIRNATFKANRYREVAVWSRLNEANETDLHEN